MQIQALITRRNATRACAHVTTLVVAGCAYQTSDKFSFIKENSTWSGRFSLQTTAGGGRSFSAAFVLRGSPQFGELTISTPLGSTLAVATWHPGLAQLQQGYERRTFSDLDELTMALTGSVVPVASWFDWLRGEATQAEGWTVDLTQIARGRMQASGVSGAETTQIRLLLDH